MAINYINPILMAEGKMRIESIPRSVSIEVSTKCPLQCTYCKREQGSGENLSFEEFLKFKEKLDEIPALERINICGIGESLLNKDIYRMIHALEKYKIMLVTSGTLLIDFEEMARCNNMDYLIFSIDATSETKMKSICGDTYNFKNLLTNLENLRNINKSKKHRKIQSILNCTVNEGNIEELPLLIDFAKEHGFCSLHYSIAWGSYKMVEDNLEKLKKYFSEAAAKAKKYGIGYFDPIKFFCCVVEDNALPFIDMKGNVYPCGFAINVPPYIAGNIFEKSFSDIWKEEKYGRFNCGELCVKCPVVEMYKFTKGRF